MIKQPKESDRSHKYSLVWGILSHPWLFWHDQIVACLDYIFPHTFFVCFYCFPFYFLCASVLQLKPWITKISMQIKTSWGLNIYLKPSIDAVCHGLATLLMYHYLPQTVGFNSDPKQGFFRLLLIFNSFFFRSGDGCPSQAAQCGSDDLRQQHPSVWGAWCRRADALGGGIAGWKQFNVLHTRQTAEK